VVPAAVGTQNYYVGVGFTDEMFDGVGKTDVDAAGARQVAGLAAGLAVALSLANVLF
jgi:hypothetical protein